MSLYLISPMGFANGSPACLLVSNSKSANMKGDWVTLKPLYTSLKAFVIFRGLVDAQTLMRWDYLREHTRPSVDKKHLSIWGTSTFTYHRPRYMPDYLDLSAPVFW